MAFSKFFEHNGDVISTLPTDIAGLNNNFKRLATQKEPGSKDFDAFTHNIEVLDTLLTETLSAIENAAKAQTTQDFVSTAGFGQSN